MNKLCIIAKNKNTYFVKRLIEEVGEGSVQVFDPWSDPVLPESGCYLARTTGVYKNDLDLAFIGSLPSDKVVNPYSSLKLFRSKKSQYEWFEQFNFPCLPWLYLKDLDPLTIEKFCILYPQILVKPNLGQGGWGIQVFSKDELLSWCRKQKKMGDEDYILQPYISKAVEFRYFFIKKQKPIVLQRKPGSGVAANFRQIGEAVLSDLPFGNDLLEGLIENSGAFYGAIDLFIQDGEILILELNTAPGIEQLEQVSGKNVARMLLDSITYR